MTDRAIFEIQVKEDGTVAFNKLADSAEKFHQHAKKAKEAAIDVGEGFRRLKDTLLEVSAAYVGMEAIHSGMEAYKEEKIALVELQGVYANNAAYTTENMHGLQDLAEQQERTTGIYKDQTENLEKNLLAHRDIKVAYSELIPAIEDLAAGHFNGNVEEAGSLFTKALGNPMRAQLALKEAGIDLTKAQQKQMIQMYETGHAAEYQSFMVKALEDRWHGLGEAKFNADPERQLQVAFHDAQVELGHFSEEILVDLMPALKGLAGDIEGVIKWSEQHKELLETIGKAIGIIGVAWGVYTVAVKAAAAADFLFGTSLAGMTLGLEAETAATGAATEGMTAFDLAMDTNPIGLMITAIAGLALVFDKLLGSSDAATKSVHAFGEQKFNLEEFTSKSLADEKKVYDEKVGQLVQAEQALKRDRETQRLHPGQRIYDPALGLEISAQQAIEGDLKSIDTLSKMTQSMANAMGVKKDTTIGKSTASVTSSLPTADSVAAKDKQINNTWNIREFGKTVMYPSTVTEGADDIHDKVLGALTTAVNDSEIASGQ